MKKIKNRSGTIIQKSKQIFTGANNGRTIKRLDSATQS